MKKYAISYLRCSTDMQDYSIEDQKSAILKWAKQNGYIIIKWYIDDGISGGSALKRPDFMRMVAEFPDIDFEAVLIWDSYRFSRNMIELLTYKQLFREAGKQVIAITEPILDPDSDAQLYLDALNGVTGEMYIRKVSKDVCRNRIAQAEAGVYIGSPAFGYEKKPWNKDYTIVEEEAKWVRYIFRATADGATRHEVVAVLRENEVRNHRGNYIDARGLWRILTNPIYKGYFSTDIKNVKIENKKALNVKPIIEEELWDKVNAIIDDNRAKKRPYQKPLHTRKHWLSGHVYCAKCGCGYTYAQRSDLIHPRFQCKGYSKGLNCYTSIYVYTVEELVLDKLEEIYNAPVSEYERFVTVPAPKITIDYDNEISKVKAQLTRAKKAYLTEIDTLEEYKENKAKLTAQLELLEEKKNATAAPAKINQKQFQAKIMNAITVLRSEASLEEKEAVADALIDRVTVDTSRRTLELYFFA